MQSVPCGWPDKQLVPKDNCEQRNNFYHFGTDRPYYYLSRLTPYTGEWVAKYGSQQISCRRARTLNLRYSRKNYAEPERTVECSRNRGHAMAKLMTIVIKVEPPALGPVLIKLKEMPGIAEFHFDINDSKAGEPLDKPLARVEEVATALLIKGPVSINELMLALAKAGHKGTRAQASQSMHILKKKGIAKGVEKGVMEMTAKARKSITGHEDTAIRLLPKPKAAQTNGKHPPKRKPPGTGQIVLLQILNEQGQLKKHQIADALVPHGMSRKSVEGVTYRARTAGLVKSDGAGLYELTAKGKQTAEQANG
jgi:hypothetical protein